MAADPRALVRVLDELLWTLRREGFSISTAQALDVARAVAAVGLERRAGVREAVACVVVSRASERARFDDLFDRFFAPGLEATGTLWDRLEAKGFDPTELDALRALLSNLGARDAGSGGSPGTVLDRGADLNRLLALSGMAAAIDAHSGSMLGFLTHRLTTEVGVALARRTLGVLRTQLVSTLGARGNELADALVRELERAEDEIRAFVNRTYQTRVTEHERDRASGRAETASLTSLTDPQIDEVRRAVRRFVERLRGAARVRARRARRGRIDAHRTLRGALRTGGVPFVIARKKRRRDRPKLMILCDVSDSVRAVARFLLEFTYAAQELFERTRSFVFVSELGETTHLFAQLPRARGHRRSVARGRGGSRGRQLELRARASCVRGAPSARPRPAHDGRHPRRRTHELPRRAAEVLDRIRERARALVWLCPEPRGQWSDGRQRDGPATRRSAPPSSRSAARATSRTRRVRSSI